MFLIPLTPFLSTLHEAMFSSPNALPEEVRQRLVSAYNLVLADGIDLYGQAKMAHWNVKGPLFSQLHAFFEMVAVMLLARNDVFAERIVALGGQAQGSARDVARSTRLTPYAHAVVQDLEVASSLLKRMEEYLGGVRGARAMAKNEGDLETENFLLDLAMEVEKLASQLHATLTRSRR